VAAPSANTFGRISPTTAAHVLEDLDGRIDAVVDAGPTGLGVESTVLDPCQTPMRIYRPGAVTVEQIRAMGGAVEVSMGGGELAQTPRAALPSPGLGLRHYAPRARLALVEAPLAELGARLGEAALRWGRWAAPGELARQLYAGLRALDALGCTVILCPLPPDEGIGAAIRDRLRKAAHEDAVE
jgi:L-threonylcarbamoyladenylate synthase